MPRCACAGEPVVNDREPRGHGPSNGRRLKKSALGELGARSARGVLPVAPAGIFHVQKPASGDLGSSDGWPQPNGSADDVKGRQRASCLEAALFGEHGYRSGAGRPRAGDLGAVRVARPGRGQDAQDHPVEPLRSRIRHLARRLRQGLGREERRRRHRRSHPPSGAAGARGGGGRGPGRPRSVRLQRLRRAAPVQQERDRSQPAGRRDGEEIRQGRADRAADRLRHRDRQLARLSRLLHPLPGALPQGSVGRDRHDSRTPGRTSARAAPS